MWCTNCTELHVLRRDVSKGKSFLMQPSSLMPCRIARIKSKTYSSNSAWLHQTHSCCLCREAILKLAVAGGDCSEDLRQI